MIKGFIFDLDGVITDTAEQHYLAWKRLADAMGWHFDREINEQLRGVSRMASLKIIADHNNVQADDPTMMQWAAEKNELYVKALDEVTPDDFLPGAKELLTHLKREGFKVALGSSSKNAKKVLQQLGAAPFFDAVADGNSVKNSKPAPDIFLYGSQALKLKPKECIVFEDAESGIDAAKAGGFYCVGIGPEERVGHADVRFEDMKAATLFEVKSHFKELF
ncbi:beta-phosphoglucomutase [Allomuricauda sp. SCSIO 65647]|uniref:beta-phosphoglucomutase n=1 Tax=Allomuricauda sp. SCSIO 65647 TaxID=2908843 RepID=UPI001F35AAEE|nr:beta-phosphoglucomutase [Muricauda sp. SCSIO 65647]UJH67941.1 beta-phosphoglucomutase [Muricauda sp. SCSIO 65647]